MFVFVVLDKPAKISSSYSDEESIDVEWEPACQDDIEGITHFKINYCQAQLVNQRWVCPDGKPKIHHITYFFPFPDGASNN